MKLVNARRIFAAFMLALTPVSTSGSPDVRDYEFQLETAKFRTGTGTLAVRLLRKSDASLVPGAVIFATRLDMAPEGMEAMKGSIEPAPSTKPGVYRFKVDLSMEGQWRLSLAAKVQGESGTVQGRLVLKATP